MNASLRMQWRPPRFPPNVPFESFTRQCRRKVAGEDLGDDRTMEPRVMGEEDACHTPAAKLTLDRVGRPHRALNFIDKRHGSNIAVRDAEGYCAHGASDRGQAPRRLEWAEMRRPLSTIDTTP